MIAQDLESATMDHAIAKPVSLALIVLEDLAPTIAQVTEIV